MSMSISQEKILHEIDMICSELISASDRIINLRDLIKSIDYYGNAEIEQLKKLLAEKDLIIKRYLESEGEK